MADEPYCVPVCPSWPNAVHSDSDDLREQWLCPTCHKPPQKIFMHTDRYALERDLWEMTKK